MEVGSVKEVLWKKDFKQRQIKKKNIFKDVINFEKKYNKLDSW